jgi:hypothetical protein
VKICFATLELDVERERERERDKKEGGGSSINTFREHNYNGK